VLDAWVAPVIELPLGAIVVDTLTRDPVRVISRPRAFDATSRTGATAARGWILETPTGRIIVRVEDELEPIALEEQIAFATAHGYPPPPASQP
jgi:hypothetical protein